jgi:lipid A 3-O-deacylase PagL
VTFALLRAAVVAATLAGGEPPQPPAPGPAPAADPFASRGWHLELGWHGALETWNYNISHEEMYALVPGLAYGVGKGVVLTARAPIYYVAQRGTDGVLLGATFGVRSRVFRRPRWSLFWELDVGISQSDTSIPPRGTNFNYLALGGGGATFRLRDGVHLMSGLRWIHVSNGGLAGRDRNPDIEAVGIQTGVLIAF